MLATWLEPQAWTRLRAAVLDAGYTRVCVDLRGFRSGSLNVLGGVTAA
jgi:PP-loop superfamily ATP-utilizing enzyme